MKSTIAVLAAVSTIAVGAQTATAAEIYGDIGVNERLEASGSNVRLLQAEFDSWFPQRVVTTR